MKKLFLSFVLAGSMSFAALSASDYGSISKEIKNFDGEIQRMATQIEDAQTKKTAPEIKVLTDKKAKLEENRAKKIGILKEILQKNITTTKTNIEKVKAQKGDTVKMEAQLKKFEDDLNQLNTDYPAKDKKEESKDAVKDDKKKDDKKK